MWPFYSEEEKERRRIKKAFGKYVSPEVIDEILNGTKNNEPELEKGKINYIIVQHKDESIEEFQINFSKSIEILQEHKAFVEHLFPPFCFLHLPHEWDTAAL